MSSGSAAQTASIPSSRRLRPAARGQVAAQPGGGGLRVEPGRVRRLPGRLGGHRPGEPVELALGALHVEQDQRVDARDRAAVAAQPAAVLEHVLARARRSGTCPPRAPRPAPPAGPGWGRSTGRPPPRRCRRRCPRSARGRPPGRAPPRPRPTRPRPRAGARGAEPGEPGARPPPRLRSRLSGSAIAAHPTPVPDAAEPVRSLCCGPMASPPRTREEERRLNARTLAIASAASASAAAVTSQLWIAGTWIAAAVTPLIVAAGQRAAPPARPSGSPARSPPTARRSSWTRPRRRRPQRPRPDPGRSRRRRRCACTASRRRRRPRAAGSRSAPWSLTTVLGLLIGGAALTAAELIAGQSIGKGDSATSLGGGKARNKRTSDNGGATPAPAEQDTSAREPRPRPPRSSPRSR